MTTSEEADKLWEKIIKQCKESPYYSRKPKMYFIPAHLVREDKQQ